MNGAVHGPGLWNGRDEKVLWIAFVPFGRKNTFILYKEIASLWQLVLNISTEIFSYKRRIIKVLQIANSTQNS